MPTVVKLPLAPTQQILYTLKREKLGKVSEFLKFSLTLDGGRKTRGKEGVSKVHIWVFSFTGICETQGSDEKFWNSLI